MSIRRALALLCIAAALPTLGGCFFVFIPGSVIDKVAGAPQYCVATAQGQVGSIISVSGDYYKVTRVAGESPHYCRNSPEGKRMGVDAVPIPKVDQAAKVDG